MNLDQHIFLILTLHIMINVLMNFPFTKHCRSPSARASKGANETDAHDKSHQEDAKKDKSSEETKEPEEEEPKEPQDTIDYSSFKSVRKGKADVSSSAEYCPSSVYIQEAAC